MHKEKDMKKSFIIIMILVVALSAAFALTACKDKYDYKIGVQSGTTGEYYIKGDADWGFDGFANIDCKPYTNGGLAVADMKAGNLDFVVIDEAPAKALAASIAGIKVINIALTEEEYAFGVDKNNNALLESINTFLGIIKEDGRFEAIINKYFGNEGTIEGITAATTADPAKAATQLVVATNAAFAPFEYKIGNKFAGIDMEIAALLAQYLEMELVIIDMDFDAVVTSVGSNNVDVAMAGLTVNETRQQSVNFTDSYYNASQMLVCLSDNTLFDACVTAADVEAILKGNK